MKTWEFADKLLTKIKEFDKISIFGHENPDPDCMGSSHALEHFIKLNFPKKVVKVLRNDYKSIPAIFESKLEPVSDEHVKGSLGIIVDLSTKSRIDVKKSDLCGYVVKIDHHPAQEKISDIDWTEEMKSSASQMVAEIISYWESKKYKTTVEMYEFTFIGMVTDTGRFLYGNMDGKTFQLLEKFYEKKMNFKKIYNFIYKRSLNEVKYNAYIQSKFHIDKDVAYIVMPKNVHHKFNITFEKSKMFVNALSNIDGINKWLVAIYDAKNRNYKISLRSKDVPINKVAEQFNGGGHKNASGCTAKNKKQIKEIVKLLKNI